MTVTDWQISRYNSGSQPELPACLSTGGQGGAGRFFRSFQVRTDIEQEAVMTAIKVGNLAPAFTLQDQDGNKVSLKDFRGDRNVILYFYPKAMTPGCTVQACGLRDSQAALKKLDTVALGISPDPVARLKKFAERDGLNFTLLSDEDHAIADKYGVWGLKKFMGREFMGIVRTTFIINKEGRLVHIVDKVKTKTHHDDVIDIIKSQL
jgi:peroxiredoxin Q/BCP